MKEILQALGRIEGKLDAEIRLAEEHRKDDVRRFGDVFKRLDEHEKDINQAKGGRAVILWLVGGGLVSLLASLAAAVKVFAR